MLSVSPTTSISSASSSSPRSQSSQLSTSSHSSSSTFSDVSSTTSTSSKTNAFFASSYESVPPPSIPRSLNRDFFALPKAFEARPTPPPSIRSPSPPLLRENSPPSLLARLFPSRYTSIKDSRMPEEQPLSPTTSDEGFTSSPVSEIDLTPRPPSFSPSFILRAGTVVQDSDPQLRLTLVRSLGQGSFSSVWLAFADGLRPKSKRSRRKTVTPLDGTRPLIAKSKELSPQGLERTSSVSSARSVYLDQRDGEGACESLSFPQEYRDSRLVAVKMTPRADERTRVSFVREAEVLRHISHPAIVAHLASFSSPTHHVLVLEEVRGGELFDLVNSDTSHALLGEHYVHRMWSDLCKAVGWMHGVGLVHRDIKLENILLTTSPLHPLPPAPYPVIKLTDFGLARFIDPTSPLLSTRCGSESYAAPELVIPGQLYDARATDAWACGVVLYTLATRQLPFGEGVGLSREDGADGGMKARRRWLMRIAKGEYEWPLSLDQPWSNPKSNEGELFGTDLGLIGGLRNVVGRLLRWDPTRRARVADIWDEEWMGGDGGRHVEHKAEGSRYEDEDEEDANDEDSVGHLVDRAGIPIITAQEVQ